LASPNPSEGGEKEASVFSIADSKISSRVLGSTSPVLSKERENEAFEYLDEGNVVSAQNI
jgi:hypothetical protein